MFRTRGVGIFDGDQLVHMAPPAEFVAGQTSDLIAWYGESTLHPLVKSTVFHYEFEFIHPFQDGDGRMGRFWHTALLGRWNPVFYWLPVEELIQKNRQGYYDALDTADRRADSSGFVEFMLELFVDALEETGFANEFPTGTNMPEGAAAGKYAPDILAELGRSWLTRFMTYPNPTAGFWYTCSNVGHRAPRRYCLNCGFHPVRCNASTDT